MQIKVKLSNLRTAPRKVRQVIDLVRGKNVAEAQSILLFTVNKSARPVLKLLNSAIDSAKKNYQLNEENLYISTITADEGPKLKRWHPMSRGRAFPIIKRSCHVALIISEKIPSDKKAPEIQTVKEVKTPKTQTTKTKSQTKPKTRNSKTKIKKA